MIKAREKHNNKQIGVDLEVCCPEMAEYITWRRPYRYAANDEQSTVCIRWSIDFNVCPYCGARLK